MSEPGATGRDWINPDDEVTKPNAFARDPMIRLARVSRRALIFSLIVGILSFALVAFLACFQLFYLQEWRAGNRALLNRIDGNAERCAKCQGK